MQRDFASSLGLFALLTVITGVLYPGVVTGIAQLAFADAANGSLVGKGGARDGTPVGSVLIGQPFSDPKYFWTRPSATSPQPYNAMASSGSNLGPTNPALADAVKERIAALRATDPGNTAPVPLDLVTASASGLDPHISVAAAEFQVARVARVRGLPETAVRELLRQNLAERDLGFLGTPRVNVLLLNLALDGAGSNPGKDAAAR
jgi:K+-transporting ATPase ATPase C chain